ncbi:transporter, major facilitator family protein [Dictyocaulus viviparus]|uniref:Transporter, major facilitator family protein n=1 Tax=Dictyocaulus viviparus TaxID=29172 RepID=A0A0D8YCK9_DICVI|nr:transporter, major facilitator family protein [Dictyocaulus viviparus]
MSTAEINTISDRSESERSSETLDGKQNELTKPILRLNMSILILVNLLNYMDRYTIAGVLTTLQSFYGINDANGGLLRTTFMIFYMICSPICGFLGDRYSRKRIMILGISIWVLAVFASTFVPANMFWTFLFFRGLVGIGEASYVVISPSIIADLFTGAERSRMLMYFYFAIPCGSGLGFVVGSSVAALTGDWRWGIRITATLERGAAEREKGELINEMVQTTYLEDLKSLSMNSTYIFSTIGYTALIFMVGTLSWWGPTAIEHYYAYREGLNSTNQLHLKVKARYVK